MEPGLGVGGTEIKAYLQAGLALNILFLQPMLLKLDISPLLRTVFVFMDYKNHCKNLNGAEVCNIESNLCNQSLSN